MQEMTNSHPMGAIRSLLPRPTTTGASTAFPPKNPGYPYGMQRLDFNPFDGNNTLFSPFHTSDVSDTNLESAIESPIVHDVVARHFEDSSHRNLITGEAIFVLRSALSRSGLDTCVTLGRLNLLLREGYMKNMIALGEYKETRPEDFGNVSFISESKLSSGRAYEKFQSDFYDTDGSFDELGYKLGGQIENTFASGLNNVIRSIKTGRDELTKGVPNDTLIAISDKCIKMQKESNVKHRVFEKSLQVWNEYTVERDEALKYLYLSSIKNMWNFIGVIRSSSGDDNGYKRALERNRNKEGPSLAIVVQKKCQKLVNYWKDGIKVNDRLWFIIKRIIDPTDGSFAEFQVIPFTNGISPPTIRDMKYTDVSGNTEFGCPIYVGKVSELPYGSSPQKWREIASGLDRSVASWKEIYDSSVKLDTLVCHVGIGA